VWYFADCDFYRWKDIVWKFDGAVLGSIKVGQAVPLEPSSSSITNYTLTAQPGFNLIANQLNRSSNGLGTVLPGVPQESQVLKFQNNNYTTDIFDGTDWVNALTQEPSVTTVSPGEGFFFFNPGPAAVPLTFTGQAVPPSLPAPIVRGGYVLLSRRDFGPGTFAKIVGLAPENGCRFVTFNSLFQSYSTNIFDGAQWLLGNPATAIGESAFVYFPGGLPLTITLQPQSQQVIEGSNVTFSVAATNGTPPLRNQWRRNGSPIAGATNATYTVFAAQPGNSGTYDVILTDQTGQSVTSSPATLRVTGPPIVFGLSGPSLTLMWPDATYKLQSASSAVGPWTDVAGATSPYIVPLVGPGRFYRTEKR